MGYFYALELRKINYVDDFDSKKKTKFAYRHTGHTSKNKNQLINFLYSKYGYYRVHNKLNGRPRILIKFSPDNTNQRHQKKIDENKRLKVEREHLTTESGGDERG